MKYPELKEVVNHYLDNKKKIKELSNSNSIFVEKLSERARDIFYILVRNGIDLDISECDSISIGTDTFSFLEYIGEGDYESGYILGGTTECKLPLDALCDDDILNIEIKRIIKEQNEYKKHIESVNEEHDRKLYEKLKERFEGNQSK